MKILRSATPASTTTTTKPPTPTSAATTKPPAVQTAAPAPAPQQSSGKSRSPPPSPPAAIMALRSMSSSGLSAGIARLLETTTDDGGGGADVEFEVGGKVFAAHKLLLAARSPVFREDLFGADKEEATRYVRVCDMHPDTFEALLHFVYTDSLPPAAVLPVTGPGGGGARRKEEHAAAAAAAAAVVLVQDLIRAADRYGLRRLKSLAETELCRSRNVVGFDTVLPMLALAERHRCWKLKDKCLEFVTANARSVMAAADDVEHLARSCPGVVKELVEILEAKEKEAAPRRRRRRPLMDGADAVFFLFLALALACILPLGMWEGF